jgi:hypothetical protein
MGCERQTIEGKCERTYAIFLKVANEHGWEVSTGLVRMSYIFERLGSVTTCGSNSEAAAVDSSA